MQYRLAFLFVLLLVSSGASATSIVATSSRILFAAAPADVLPTTFPPDSFHRVFGEQQDLLLSAPLTVFADSTAGSATVVIPAGTVVSSFLLYHGPESSALLGQFNTAEWIQFDAPVLGFIKHTGTAPSGGATLDSTDALFGASGTTYPTNASPDRGTDNPAPLFGGAIQLEDLFSVRASDPSFVDIGGLVVGTFPPFYTDVHDQVRILVLSVPEPALGALLVCAALAAATRRVLRSF